MSNNFSPPFPFPDVNIQDSFNPSGVTVGNTGAARFFRKYLLQEAFSVYKFSLPKNWDESYFLYNFFVRGHLCIANFDKFGIIPQGGNPAGYNVFYRPRRYVVANPLFTKSHDLVIGEDCEVLRYSTDWTGIADLVAYYADFMALAMQTAGVNLINSRLSYVLYANNKATAESLKKAMDDLLSGKPYTAMDNKNRGAEGENPITLLTQNVKQNFIAPDVINTLTLIKNNFLTAIGLDNVNVIKKERVTTDEVNANNEQIKSVPAMKIDQWRRQLEQVNDHFGLDIAVSLRNGGDEDETTSASVNTRPVSL